MSSIYQFINQQGYLCECINDIDPNSTNIYVLLIFPIKIKGINTYICFTFFSIRAQLIWLVALKIYIIPIGKNFTQTREEYVEIKRNLKINFKYDQVFLKHFPT